jgi:hypothetical protein
MNREALSRMRYRAHFGGLSTAHHSRRTSRDLTIAAIAFAVGAATASLAWSVLL